MTDKEIEVVKRLNHPVYTVEHLKMMLAKKRVDINLYPDGALVQAKVEGFYKAIQLMAEMEET